MATAAPPPPPIVRSVYADEEPATPFCAWLLKQTGASGFVGGLAKAAAGDRTFPRSGDVEAARKWLQRLGASGDDWEALYDAESAWLVG